ncbi:DUF222 domain-containing protein, partial [Nesterenkonia sp. MY13]
MGKKTSTPEEHSVLEAARDHHKRELREQAEKVSQLLVYKSLRMDEMKGDHSFSTHAFEKSVYRECAEALGVPLPEVRRLIGAVEAVAEKLPATHALYLEGEADLASVHKVNRAIEGISHRHELLETLDGELITKARDLNSAELDNWLKQRVPELDVKAYEERYERSKHKHYVAFEPQGDGSTKFHGLISTVAAARIEQMLYSMARNKPRKSTNQVDDAGSTEERTHTQRMADIFTNALTRGLQGEFVTSPAEAASPEGADSQGHQPLPWADTTGLTSTGETPNDPTPTAAADSPTSPPSNSIPEPTGAGAAKIGILVPVKTLTGESDDPVISWDRTWMLPASEARAIAADSSAKHDWYAVGVAKGVSTGADAEEGTSTGVGEVLTVTKARTTPASTRTEDIDQWVSKTDPEAQNLLTMTYESRTARDHQRNAVLIRDGQCQTSGCTQPGWLAEIDHKQSFETGGATTGENLQTLCKACRAPRGAVGSSGGERPLPL